MSNGKKKNNVEDDNNETSSHENEDQSAEKNQENDENSAPKPSKEENTASGIERIPEKKSADSKTTPEPEITEKSGDNPKEEESETCSQILESMYKKDEPAKKHSLETLFNLHKSAVDLKNSEEKTELIVKKTKSEDNTVEPNKLQKSVTFEDEAEEVEGETFTFDEAVDSIGYGNFQRMVTFYTGLGWFAESFAIIISYLIQDFMACDINLLMWEVAALTSSMFIGMMLGAPVFGIVADKYGRRFALAISMAMAFVFGSISAVAPTPEWMMLGRGLMGFSLGSLAQGVTLCIEFYPVKDRGTAGFYINYYWCIGNAVLILIIWVMFEATKNWRWIVLVSSFPCIIAFVVMKWYPESVRYYMVSNQYDKAVSQLEKLAVANKHKLPSGRLEPTFEDTEESMGNAIDLLKYPHTLSTLLYWYIWFAVSFHYYGLQLITPVIVKHGKINVSPEELASSFGTNLTSNTNFFMSEYPCKPFTQDNYIELFVEGCSEIPGIIIYPFLVQWIARNKLLAYSVLANAVLVLVLLIDFGNTYIIYKIIIFAARMNAGGFYQLIMIMTGEAFPTTLRATSLGSSHAFSMFGAAVVPFSTQILVITHPILTACIMSAVIFLVSVCACLLPREMKDVPIKDYSEQFLT